MFDARIRVDSIRLFVSMDTVSRHALISLNMAYEEDVLVDLSENVIEDKKKRKGNKVRTRRWTDQETDIPIDMFEESACLWDIFSKDYHMKDKRDRGRILCFFDISTCFDKTCVKMFYAVWPLCKTSACFSMFYGKTFTVWTGVKVISNL